MRYGGVEYAFAEPIAQSLVQDEVFRRWIIGQTEFANFADARLLHKEMKAHRSAVSENWWRSHFTEACRCEGCSGKETDLLAIFEATTGFRFALHFEIKRPGDKFKNNGIQSRGYSLRALCWANKAPAKVLPHDKGSTALIMSEVDRMKFALHLVHFKTLITFEEIKKEFPHAAPNHP